MIALVTPWSHGLAALLFAALAVWQIQRPRGGMQRRTLALAFAGTALWAVVVGVEGPESAFARFTESGRNLTWLGFMLALLVRGQGDERRPVIVALHVVLALVILGQSVAEIAIPDFAGSPRIVDALFYILLLLRMTVAIGALVLVHNLYTAASPEARWGIRLPMIGLAAMWTYDLNLYTVAYLSHELPLELFAIRGAVMVLLVPMFALGSQRNPRWKMRLSRTAAFQSLSLIAIGGYLMAMVVVARALELAGGDYVRLAQVTVAIAMLLMALALAPSARLRAWLKVKLVKHLFQHRYDYRAEWLRFTDTLGRPGEGAAPLDERVVKAIADITESPGGLLLLPDESGGLAAAARWNWKTIEAPLRAAEAALARHCEATGRIIEFDALRKGQESLPGEVELIPDWIMADPRAWVAVPLVHIDRLVGIVLLERPLVDRMLDWEDFDLLRVAGRQVASYLAEARGQEALSEAKRFDEFSRRFAFIIHDIKNLVSQLSLVARNAERHADNPEFRADMVATLRNSVEKMNELLARLSQHNKSRAEEPRPLALKALVEAIAAPKRGLHPIQISGRSDIIALADPARLEQAIGHLLQNAIDASAPGEAVCIAVERHGLEAAIEILDRGLGMDAEFVRTRLFKPFASTKQGGFGIGAFEARTLIATMGGRLEVESREGEGSRFTIVLPMAEEGREAAERPAPGYVEARVA
jgi:putative PEP-CTERM system histidine kinase